MKLLLIDTATSVCSVAVADGTTVLAETLINSPGPSSSQLSECIQQAIALAGYCLADLDGFGVSTGPGAFTSLRVGLSTVKGLSLATGKPIAAFSSLALLAANLPLVDMPVCPLFDARKGEVYAGVYRSGPSPEPTRPDSVISPTDFIASLTGSVIFVGDGAERYRSLIESQMGDFARFAPSWANLPRVSTILPLVTTIFSQGRGISPAALLPTYLRMSEAEVARMTGKN